MKKILLPLDGSKRSLRTVEAVKEFCSPEEEEIYLTKVIASQLYLNSMEEIRRHVEATLPELENIASMLLDYNVHTQVLLGSNPGAEIVEYAKEIEADAILMTRSSRGPLRKMGSVATYLVKNATFLDLYVMHEEG